MNSQKMTEARAVDKTGISFYNKAIGKYIMLAVRREKSIMTKQKATVSDKTTKKEKKAEKKAKTAILVEMGNLSIDVSGVKDTVKKAVKAQGLDAQDLKIYINTAE